MEKLRLYLDRLDPYYTQRLLLHKSLFVATVFVYISWMFHLQNYYTSFMYPIALLGNIYESTQFTSYHEKRKAFVVTFCIAALAALVFYLTFQFKVIFMFVFLGTFTLLYFGYSRFFPSAKPFIVVTLVVACMNMSLKPAGALYVAKGVFSLILFAMMIGYVCILIFPNYYHKVWIRAYRLYINAIRDVLIADINGADNKSFIAGTTHMNMMRSYRRLLKKKAFYKATRAGFAIGNVFALMCCLEVNKKNKEFWISANEYLRHLSIAIKKREQVVLFSTKELDSSDKIELYFVENLNKSVKNWNALCSLV